jgi:hypothetical protein
LRLPDGAQPNIKLGNSIRLSRLGSIFPFPFFANIGTATYYGMHRVVNVAATAYWRNNFPYGHGNTFRITGLASDNRQMRLAPHNPANKLPKPNTLSSERCCFWNTPSDCY